MRIVRDGEYRYPNRGNLLSPRDYAFRIASYLNDHRKSSLPERTLFRVKSEELSAGGEVISVVGRFRDDLGKVHDDLVLSIRSAKSGLGEYLLVTCDDSLRSLLSDAYNGLVINNMIA